MCLKNGDREIQIVWSNETNFDRITLAKFSLRKFSVKNFDQVFDKNFDRVNGL